MPKLANWLRRIVAMDRRSGLPPIDQNTDNVHVAADVDIHHKFVFDVGRAVDPLEGARRILSSDIGLTAVATSTGEVFDPTRLQELRRLVGTARQFSGAAEDISQRGTIGTVAYMLRHPSIPARTLALHLRGRNGEGSSGSDEIDEDLSLEDVERLIAEMSILLALQHHIDLDLLRPQYLASDPWIRVELQPCFLTTRAGDVFEVDVVLVLHRTGTAVLTFYVHHDGPLDTNQLIERTVSKVPAYAETELAAAVVESAAQGLGMVAASPIIERYSSGVRWSKWSHDDDAMLADVFEMYADALRAVLNADNPTQPKGGDSRSFTAEWHAYPVICIHRPDPELKPDGRLAPQLGAIVGRIASWQDYDTAFLLESVNDNWSRASDRSYWFNEASATLIHHSEAFDQLVTRFGGAENIPGQEWIRRDQEYAVVFDLLLAHYHTTVAINRQVEQVTLSSDAVEGVKARMLVARADVARESHFTFSDLNRIEARYHELRCIPEYWKDAEDKLGLVDEVLASREAERRFRSERALHAVIGVVAAVVGLPAISDLVRRVAAVETLQPGAYGGLGRVVNWASEAAQASSGAITVVVSTVLIVLLLVVFWLGRRPRRGNSSLAERGQGIPIHRPLYQYFPGQHVTISRSKDGVTVTVGTSDDS